MQKHKQEPAWIAESAPTAHTNDDNFSKDSKRKLLKLDDELLKSERGFPFLLTHSAEMLNKLNGGEGHEIKDCELVLNYLREWHNHVYPKCTFREFLLRVEKLASSNKLQVKGI